MKTGSIRFLISLVVATMLSQCSLVGPLLEPSKVIYALSPQNVSSPLSRELEPACDSITFSRDHFVLSKRQRTTLAKQATQWQEEKQHLLIVGFAQRGFPASYARSLSQRRAESVRQVLIEEGLDAALLHSTGFGHDQTLLGSDDEVRLFFTK